ncbi:uncharacterized protein L203_104380 [Cryptococcus depauperatus CBS 7841]|uniref:Origin recognition complex subunit 4 n=1 Tax=Cryptococcus depauperatus CBS 7841 TaxID=1295531 RepID=A0AAJ8JVM4_9TREE
MPREAQDSSSQNSSPVSATIMVSPQHAASSSPILSTPKKPVSRKTYTSASKARTPMGTVGSNKSTGKRTPTKAASEASKSVKKATPKKRTPVKALIGQGISTPKQPVVELTTGKRRPPPKSARREDRLSPTPNKKDGVDMEMRASLTATAQRGVTTPTKQKTKPAETPLSSLSARAKPRGTPTLGASLRALPSPRNLTPGNYTPSNPTPLSKGAKRARVSASISKALTFEDDIEDDDRPSKREKTTDISREMFLRNEAQRKQKEARNFNPENLDPNAPRLTRSGRTLGDVFRDDDAVDTEALDNYGSSVDEPQPNPFEETPLIPDIPITEQLAFPPVSLSANTESSKAASPGIKHIISAKAKADLRLMLDILTSRGNMDHPRPMVGEEDNDTLKGVLSLVKGTVERGEGNSCLIVGPRGSGKTHTVNRALSLLPVEKDREPIIVRLSGLAQTNDRLAIREMGRQISLAEGCAYDATEDGEGVESVDEEYAPTTLPSHLLALLTAPSARAVIVVIEEFDLFTEHARQTLLYCLFDVVQSVKTGPTESTPRGIAVIGVTTRTDTLLLLEKRVKSRFSHRVWRVTSPLAPVSKDEEEGQGIVAWKEVVRWALVPYKYGFEPTSLHCTASEVSQMEVEKKEATVDGDGETWEWRDEWDRCVDLLLNNPRIIGRMERLVSLTTDVRILYRPFIQPLTDVLNEQSSTNCLTHEQLANSILAQVEGAGWGLQTSKLLGLPHPALGILIIAKHLAYAGREEFNFAMVEEEYLKFSRQRLVGSGKTRWPVSLLRSGYDHLIRLSLLIPTPSTGAGRQHPQFSKVRCAFSPNEIIEWFKGPGKNVLGTELTNWGRTIGGHA